MESTPKVDTQVSEADPLTIIAQQLRRLFSEAGESAYFENLEELIVTEAFAHVNHNQVHGAALLGISRNVMRTLLKRHGFLADTSNYGAEQNGFYEELVQANG